MLVGGPACMSVGLHRAASPNKLLAVFLVLNWMCLTAAAPSQRGSWGYNFRLRSSNCHCHGVFISFHTVMAPVAVFFKQQRHLAVQVLMKIHIFFCFLHLFLGKILVYRLIPLPLGPASGRYPDFCMPSLTTEDLRSIHYCIVFWPT